MDGNGEQVALFNGKDLEGWAMTGDPGGWKMEEGCIVCTGTSGGYLYTEAQYQDFELSMEFKYDEGANSGVFFRWSDLNDPVQTGIEIQIMDTYGTSPPTTHCCGAVYDIQAPTRNTCKNAGEWNQMVLSAQGTRLGVNLNDEEIVKVDLEAWTEAGKNPDGTPNKFNRPYREMVDRGHIGIQGDHSGNIWLRNLGIIDR